MIIDSHRHLPLGNSDMAKLIAQMDADGFDKTVLFGFQGMNISGTAHIQDKAVLMCARENPGRILPFLCDFDFYNENAPEYIRKFAAADEFYGVGEVLYGHTAIRKQYLSDRPIDGEDAIAVYRTAGSCGLPVLMHADPQYRNEFENAIEQCPETNFIWAHIAYDFNATYGGAGCAVSYIKSLCDRFSNVFFDISHWTASPLYLCADEWRGLLESRSDRFLFGMDMTGDYMTERVWLRGYQEILSGLSEEARHNIYGKNVMDLLNINRRLPMTLRRYK